MVVPPEKHEAYHVGGHRNVTWHDDYEARGHKFELTPGDAVHVPLMWPHWVKNGPEPSISFSITWKSDWVYEEADVRGMNHLLRKWGMEPASPAPFPRPQPRQGLCLSRDPQGAGAAGQVSSFPGEGRGPAFTRQQLDPGLRRGTTAHPRGWK